MKKRQKFFSILVTLILGACNFVQAQPHTGGNPAAEPGNPQSIGAPVGDGLVYLLIFASLYLSVKIYLYLKVQKSH